MCCGHAFLVSLRPRLVSGAGMKALTTQEIDKLLADVSDARLHAAILLGFRHGMRASEICGLRWADVDLAAGSIIVRRLKNSITTTQPLAAPEIAALSQLEGRGASEWVFPSQRACAGGKARHLSRITFYRLFKAACRQSGIADKSPHGLKHALAYAMVDANISLPIIQRALGHKSISSTAVYAQATDRMAGEAISKALDGGKQ